MSMLSLGSSDVT